MLLSFFIAELQASAVAKVGKAAFHDIAFLPQTTSVFRTTRSQFADNAHSLDGRDDPGKSVATIPVNGFGLGAHSATQVRNLWHHSQQLHQLSLFTAVGWGDPHRQGKPGRIRQQVAFTAVFPAVDRVRSRVRPPKTARTACASATAWLSCTLPSRPNAWTKRSWISSHTPAFVQSRRRRQQVDPLTPKASVGRLCQDRPARKTKIMPRRHMRSFAYGWPPLGCLGCLGN